MEKKATSETGSGSAKPEVVSRDRKWIGKTGNRKVRVVMGRNWAKTG